MSPQRANEILQQNIAAFEAAFNFLVEEREAAQRRFELRTPARRVTFITIGDTPEVLAPQHQNVPRHVTYPPHEQDFFLEVVAAPPKFECHICFEAGVEDIVCFPKKCHIFHRACLNRWMNRSQTCPTCRASYNL